MKEKFGSPEIFTQKYQFLISKKKNRGTIKDLNNVRPITYTGHILVKNFYTTIKETRILCQFKPFETYTQKLKIITVL